jgi:hypothetical protein
VESDLLGTDEVLARGHLARDGERERGHRFRRERERAAADLQRRSVTPTLAARKTTRTVGRSCQILNHV